MRYVCESPVSHPANGLGRIGVVVRTGAVMPGPAIEQPPVV
jgi:hypothetical protein